MKLKNKDEAERDQAFLQKCYQEVFAPTQATELVLKDLAEFCRAFESTFHMDPRIHAALEGRREVWLRIMEHIKLSTNELYDIYIRR